MEREAILEALVELAEEAGIAVRRLPAAAAREGDPPVRSGACRLRGEPRVWLAPGDPLEDRIEAVAGALRREAASLLEERYLPPAVRERVEGSDPPPGEGLGGGAREAPPGR